MAYRNEADAMSARSEYLRRELERAEADSTEFQRINAELEQQVAALSRLRLSEAERQVATRKLRIRSLGIGATIAFSLVAIWAIAASILLVAETPSSAVNKRPVAPQPPALAPASPKPALEIKRPSIFTAEELAQLDRDIAALQASDPAPEVVREIGVQLAAKTWSTAGSYESDALKARSPAIVPMLLKQAATGHDSDTTAFLFSALTGEPVVGHWGLNAERAHELYLDWWQANRNQFTVDTCKMQKVSRRAVARTLAKRYSGDLGRQIDDRTLRFYASVLTPSLCPTMADDLLSMVDDERLRYGATVMLSLLRARGHAPQLDDAIRDTKRSSPERLVALLAMAEAGEPLQQKVLMDLFRREKDSKLREAMIHAMGRGDATVIAPLIKEINGPLRTAATGALGKFKSREAVPSLRRVLLSTESSNGMRDVTGLLAAIGTSEAVEALADNLERLSRLENRPEDWGNTLLVFVEATHSRQQRFASTVAEFRTVAASAVAEWRARQLDESSGR